MAKQAKKTSSKKAAVKKTAAKTTVKKQEKVPVRILNPVLGKYKITAEVGKIKHLHHKQAQEVVSNGDGEIVK